jgi:protein TonB
MANNVVLELPPQSTYGAVELKEYIKKHTIKGFLIVCAILLLLILGYFAAEKASEAVARNKANATGNSKIQMTKIENQPEEEKAQVIEQAPPQDMQDIATIVKAGNPVPVPDAEASEMKEFAAFDQMTSSLSSETGKIVDLNALPSSAFDDLNNKPQTQVEVKTEEALPGMDDFQSLETEPDVDLAELARNVVYPEVARKAGIEGKVTVSVLIDKQGKPKKVVIRESSSSALNNAAIDAVKKTSFKPGIQNRQPVTCWLLIPVVFKLQ